MNTRTAILTPECQSLWVVSPSILLLYDKVVMDERDAIWMHNPSTDTKLAQRRSEILLSLQNWGLVETVPYDHFLDADTRSWIAVESPKIVAESLPKEGEAFGSSTFAKRALHAHREYASYVENTIYFCSSADKWSLKKNCDRLLALRKRIHALEGGRVSDNMLEQIHWTLERVVSKALAGLEITQPAAA